jgi:glyoxylase-like metal-dependent hydrolase (beta-lactamase superfamily II)
MANSGESALHYPLGEVLPQPGTTMEIAPGVHWLRMPLPFALNHINLWLLRDRGEDGRDGWAIVDCGITDEATRGAWQQIFERELLGLPVLRVIVTHMHPDHIGLAHWLTARWNCRLWISATDWNAARLGSQKTTSVGGESAAAFFASHGLTDATMLAQVRVRTNYYGNMVPAVPSQFRRLMDRQVLAIGGQHWRCIAGYGHAPEHIALHCPELTLLISGDMVLPRISTNVSVIDLEPEADPLALYLTSIGRLRELPANTLVLPSHGKPFVGLHPRIDQLEAHHDQRLADTLEACRASATTAADLLPVLFKRQMDLHQTTFAMGEAVAHLNRLAHAGRIRDHLGADGVHRFQAV